MGARENIEIRRGGGGGVGEARAAFRILVKLNIFLFKVEKVKKFLLLKVSLETSSSETKPESETVMNENVLSENKKKLLLKCIKYINHGRLNSECSPTNSSTSSPTTSLLIALTNVPNVNVNKLHINF